MHCHQNPPGFKARPVAVAAFQGKVWRADNSRPAWRLALHWVPRFRGCSAPSMLPGSVDDVTRACTTVIDFTAPDRADSFSETHVQYVHAENDVRSALSDAGFDLVSVTDEYTDLPVTGPTLRATWVARRMAS